MNIKEDEAGAAENNIQRVPGFSVIRNRQAWSFKLIFSKVQTRPWSLGSRSIMEFWIEDRFGRQEYNNFGDIWR